MDAIKIAKIQAINKYRRQQLLNNLFLYSLTALTCSFFCSSPFCYPPLFSCMKVFLFVSLAQISSLFFSSKFFFIVCNLIVIFLVREPKMFASDSSSAGNVCYDEYVDKRSSLCNLSSLDNKKEAKLEKSIEEKVTSICREDKEGWIEEKQDVDEELDEEGFGLPAEEFNKRAEDFIARVNKQRRIEAALLICSNE